MKKCDIIIPIYNAYDCLVPCIESVIKNTTFESNKLILINDQSSDKRVKPLLEKYEKKYDFIEYFENEVNLGFVATVNRGMKYSKNDVILLNSDTEVTQNWLEKMQKCAYSELKVATVTPISNNATLVSVPESFVPNDLPKDYTLEQMNQVVEASFNHEYPELPTGHGFCLYIKREVLDDVGYFDEQKFGKGYGEENDFCFRCLNKGYRHLLCPNTYIYHKESQSFSAEKEKLISSGLKVLETKYPQYKENLDFWCMKNPLKYIGKNIALTIDNQKKRPNILYIIHDWKDIENNLGGTSLHVYDLIQSMRDQYNFHVFTIEDGCYKLYSYWENYESDITFPQFSEFHKLRFYNSEYKKILEQILDDYAISLVHIHHMIGHYFDIVDILKERKIKSIITLHDYYCVCPIINKIYKNQTYCSKSSPEKCKECLKCVLKVEIDIQAWRKEWERLFQNIDVVLVPSEAAKLEILQDFPNLKMTVIEHGIDLPKLEAEKLKKRKKYNVAFVGAIGVHKGSRILQNLMKYSKLGNIKIHLFGIVDSPYQNNTRYFINHGRYKREELNKKLKENKIDLVCLFSTWPETYSYTLTEAIACGIPVLAYDFGAIAERIKKHHFGWVIDPKMDYIQITKKMHDILNQPEEYNKVIKKINQYHIKTVQEMADEYINLYKNKVKAKEVNLDHIKKQIYENGQYISNVSYNNYAWILDTFKWKLISKLKIPKKVKKIVRKVTGK